MHRSIVRLTDSLVSPPSFPSLLSHISSDGSARQVDVSNKNVTKRTAIAEGTVKLTSEIIRQVKQNELKKGDVLSVANIAAVLASKQTSHLIPLCHNIPISQCKTEFDIDESNSSIHIRCLVSTSSTTGVEMEALTAVSVAALSIYDMCKSVSQNMQITNIKVVRKTGGKSDIGHSEPAVDTVKN